MNPRFAGLAASWSRRQLLVGGARAVGFAAIARRLTASTALAEEAAPSAPSADLLADRVRGLVLGSFLGDALGGPIEFQDPAKVHALADAPHRWRDDEVFDDAARADAVARLHLRSYADLRPKPEPYAHWTSNAPAGAITDDSRHKLILLDGLRRAESRSDWPFDVRAMARAFLDWPQRPAIRDHPEFAALAADWLREWQMPARWVLGERNLAVAFPPERMWNGLPTCCGQMTLPPLAVLYPGDPEAAYRAAFHLAFFDNGWGRDLNAAWVASLSASLTLPPTSGFNASDWEPVYAALTATDPFGYAKVPWTTRSVDRWLAVARRLVAAAEKRPARLFAALDTQFRDTIKWEAQVPFVVAFAVLELADYHPLAALQLSLEWGHDTDSYAQILGAMVGARYGARIFPAALSEPVGQRLSADYGETVDDLVSLLTRLRRRAGSGVPLIAER